MKLRITKIAKAKGMTVGEVAKAMNMQPSSLSHISSGRANTTTATLEQLAQILEVTYLELIEPPKGYTDLYAGEKHIGVIRDEYGKRE